MRSTSLFLRGLLVATIATVGCIADPTGPGDGPGNLEVRVATIGMGIEPDSVTVLVDGQRVGAPSGTDLLGVGWFQRVALAPGSHEVRLEGVAPNCGLDRARTVEVPRAGATIHLVLTCELALGDLVVVRQTAAAWGDLTYVPPEGKAPERIGLSEVRSAAWSPDGSRLAVIAPRSGRQALLLVDRHTGGVTELGTEMGLWPGDLSWSPDGTTLGFTQLFQSGQSTAMLVDVDGSNPRPLLAGESGTSTASPVWSPGCGGRLRDLPQSAMAARRLRPAGGTVAVLRLVG